jgi:23S rRNA pseudouridine955/2504/2580 synthase/23S rRNA pseudouridine1911/1915/1917 synthase
MPNPKLSIIYEDENMVALNKPSGMLTIPDRKGEPALKNFLAEKYGEIYTVHRLDRETSGLVVFAKNAGTHKYLSQLFEGRQIKKYYVGIVKGEPIPSTGDIEAPITEHPVLKGTMVIHRTGKASHTGYEVIDANRFYSLVRFQLFTGRTHQIRVHAKHMGHPLACDPLYGDGLPVLLSSVKKKFKFSKTEEERPIINRVALHAYQLSFQNAEGKDIFLEAPIPKEFTALMNQLHKI